MNFITYNENGLELFINPGTGESYSSIRGLARMIDKEESSVRKYVNRKSKGAELWETKKAEIPTQGGLQGAELLNEKQMVEIISKYKPSLFKQFAAFGLRKFIHKTVGYQDDRLSKDLEALRQEKLNLTKEVHNLKRDKSLWEIEAQCMGERLDGYYQRIALIKAAYQKAKKLFTFDEMVEVNRISADIWTNLGIPDPNKQKSLENKLQKQLRCFWKNKKTS